VRFRWPKGQRFYRAGFAGFGLFEVHQTWVGAEEENIAFITLGGAWAVNVVEDNDRRVPEKG
jgi:hypothetical protein